MTKPYIALLDTDTIVCQCLMIPENETASGYHEIWDKERWADEFI